MGSLSRTFMVLGSVSAMIAVAAGAFGAHALRERLSPNLLAAFETGARYQMYHASCRPSRESSPIESPRAFLRAPRARRCAAGGEN